MSNYLVKSKFTVAELDNKSVQFRVPLEQGGTISGDGKLRAKQEAGGCIRIAIDHVQMTHEGALANRVFIPQEGADNLIRNPPGSTFEFVCFVV